MPGPSHSDVATFRSLVDILDDALARRPDRPALGMRGDDAGRAADGHPAAWHWSYRELARRSKLAAWRIRAMGLQPGDRLVTWSASCPQLAAVYFGAMRARVVVVPLDMRMTADTVERMVARSRPSAAALGSGRDAPDPVTGGLGGLPRTTVDALTADPPDASAPDTLPADWEVQVDGWERPTRDELFEVIFTSGTTGYPKGVMLTHGEILSSIDAFGLVIPPIEHRVVSLLPLSHLMEQAAALFYATLVGADILYIRSRNPRVIFEAIRDHHVTTMLVVPAIMELFWSALTREIARRGQTARFERVRRIARHLPYGLRRLLFRSIHAQFGGGMRLFVTAGAYLPPALQQAWEDLGVIVMQGYGATECGIVSCSTLQDHAPGTVGRTPSPSAIDVRLADDGEILVAGPTVFQGYWDDPEATAKVLDPDGSYHTGDVGRHDERGNLVLLGRTRNIIVLPNGFNVYPEDIENALHDAGLRETVVIETEPGRIEAIVLPPDAPSVPDAGTAARPHDPAQQAALTAGIEQAVRAANERLSINQRIQGWRLWPEADFPRTHTFKIRRDAVQARFHADAPLPFVHAEPGPS